MTEDRVNHEAWPQRVFLLMAVGAVLAWAFYQLADRAWDSAREPLRLAGASAVAVGGLVFAFTLERLRWLWSALFALSCAIVASGIVYWNEGPEGWRFASLILFLFIAAPLFQLVRDEGRWRLDQRPIHAHAWSNGVLWGAAWLFVLVVVLLTFLLAQLFGLIGIEAVKKLVETEWFMAMLIGGSLGAVIGLLRDRDEVVGVLQRIVTILLSTLTPLLAVALGLFILSLPFTGLEPLWRQTRDTTPILLGSALVAFFFTNATIGNAPDQEPRNPIFRYGALILALVMLPLAVIAAISTGLRIGQYGLTPDRLWAVVCIAAVIAYGAAYWLAVARARSRWPDAARTSNVVLAIGLCGLALLLATPLIDFGAFSTRDQVHRLVSGKVAADKFDWRALAFDFGPSGRKALEQLQRSGPTAAVRTQAKAALAFKSRWDMPDVEEQTKKREALAKARVLPRQVALPPALAEALGKEYGCVGERPCTILYAEGAEEAVLVSQPDCVTWSSNEQKTCSASTIVFRRTDSGWARVDQGQESDGERPERVKTMRGGWAAGKVEIREVKRRQVFVGGEPAGDAFK